VRDGRTAATDDTEKIQRQHACPYFIVDVFEPSVLGIATGHVDQDVDLTKLVGGLADRLLD